MNEKDKTSLAINIITILLQSPLVIDKASAVEILNTAIEMVKKGF